MSKKSNKKQPQSLSPERLVVERGRKLPLEACYLCRDSLLESGEGIGYVVRRHDGGKWAVGAYLIDKWCLGVKDTFFRVRMEDSDYRDFLDSVRSAGAVEVPYEELHNWVFGALEFAAEAGIAPHKGFAVTRYLLEDDEDERIPIIEYEFGQNGMHHLCVQTAQEAARYLPILNRNLGTNFHFTLRDGFMPDEYDDDPDEDDDFEYIPEPEYSYSHPDYPSAFTWRNKDLEALLTGPDEVPEDDVVRRILKDNHEFLKQDLEDFILKVLHDTADIKKEEVGDDGLLLILSLLLLGQVGDSGSLDVAIEVLRQSHWFNEHHFGDWTDTILVPVIAALCPGNFGKLLSFLEEPGRDEMFRTTAIASVCVAANKDKSMRPEAIAMLSKVLDLYTTALLRGENPLCGSTSSGVLVCHLIDFGAVELKDKIEALYATGRVDSTVSGSLDSVLEDLHLYETHPYYDCYSQDLYEILENLR